MRRDAEIFVHVDVTHRDLRLHVRALDANRVQIIRAWRKGPHDERWKSAPDLLGVETLDMIPSIGVENAEMLSAKGDERM